MAECSANKWRRMQNALSDCLFCDRMFSYLNTKAAIACNSYWTDKTETENRKQNITSLCIRQERYSGTEIKVANAMHTILWEYTGKHWKRRYRTMPSTSLVAEIYRNPICTPPPTPNHQPLDYIRILFNFLLSFSNLTNIPSFRILTRINNYFYLYHEF